MILSVFDIFKIGVGPSSSHTMGPMLATKRFLTDCQNAKIIIKSGVPKKIRIILYGSLSFTGRGHATDRAVIAGLLGFSPENFDHADYQNLLDQLSKSHTLKLATEIAGVKSLEFDPDIDVVFDKGPALKGHPNGMKVELLSDTQEQVASEVYYSVGGGFILTEDELAQRQQNNSSNNQKSVPFPFNNATELLALSEENKISIAELVLRNEKALLDNLSSSDAEQKVIDGFDKIWQTMNKCIEKGLLSEGILPGGLGVRRRASSIKQNLLAKLRRNDNQPHSINDWMSLYAMAVNEENASGGTVVTAPTNGAAGVIPAVIKYWLCHCHGADEAMIRDFLCTAGVIGIIIKTNASISGAEVGCQGEVGSAAAMAAAGLCAVLGGSPEQIENAAEIALEHHLGMTCDPVAGLVQVPCIERNGLGAIKAVSSASLALHGDGKHFVSLDNCVETMRQTGLDMSSKYKETSQGGLAVNIPAC